MAQRVLVELLDDLDGTAAEETVRFGIDGASYEIDLTSENATRLREVLTRFVEAARRESRLSRPARQTTVATGVDPTTVRAWARANGISVSPRGRLPSAVVERFRDAGN